MHWYSLAAWRGRGAHLLATACAGAAFYYFATAPVYGSGDRLADVNGTYAYFLTGAPLLLAAAPLGVPPRHAAHRLVAIGSALLLTVFALLGAASIGLFYIPAALCAIVGAVEAPASKHTAG